MINDKVQVRGKKVLHKVQACHDTFFHDIACLKMGDEFGFEGYYMGDLDHPDPRPGHAIWVNKKDAEKLYRLFTTELKDEVYKLKDKILEASEEYD